MFVTVPSKGRLVQQELTLSSNTIYPALYPITYYPSLIEDTYKEKVTFCSYKNIELTKDFDCKTITFIICSNKSKKELRGSLKYDIYCLDKYLFEENNEQEILNDIHNYSYIGSLIQKRELKPSCNFYSDPESVCIQTCNHLDLL